MKRVCLAVFMSMGAIFVAAVPGQAATVIPTPPGVNLTISNVPGTDSTDPHVSGDVIAYTNVSGNEIIHYHNVVTGVDSTIPNGQNFDFLSDIDNGRIVFSHSTIGTNGAIFLFDTSTPLVVPRELNPTAGSARDSASIGGNTVAWQDRTAFANAQLVVYDLVTGTAIALTTDGATMQNLEPDVSPDGKVVAWVKCQPDSSGCQVWDATQDAGDIWTSRPLTAPSPAWSLSASHPATNGRIVVYALGQPLNSGSIGYQPVLGGVEQTITMPASTGVTTEVNPSISGDLVAFDGYAATGLSSIWVADLLAGTVYQVSPVTPPIPTLTDISLAADGTATVVWQALVNSGSYYAYYAVYSFRYHPDRTAPLLTLPSNMTVSATSSAGAVVNYTVTASDPDNAVSELTLSCALASGATFPIGTTTVNCTASDPALNTTTGGFTVTVAKATPVITWVTPADITYPTALSGTQLNATASVAGTFTYNPPAGTVPAAGAGQTLTAIFTPTDASFNTGITTTRLINVLKATQVIAFGPLANKTVADPDFSVGATSSSGLLVSFTATGACTVSGTTVHITGAGSCTITASQAGSANYNAATPVSQTFSIAMASPTQDVKLTLANVGGFTSGDVGAYIIIVSNTGKVATSGILTVTDILPVGLTYAGSLAFGWSCSASGQTVTCSYGQSLPAHWITGLVLFAKVPAPNGTVLTDTGTVTPSDATPADNTASVTVTVKRSGDH